MLPPDPVAGTRDDQQATEQNRIAIERSGRHPWALSEYGVALVQVGERESATDVYDELVVRSRSGYGAPGRVAGLCAALGKTDEAFRFLERGYETRDAWCIHLRADPNFDLLRPDPASKPSIAACTSPRRRPRLKRGWAASYPGLQLSPGVPLTVSGYGRATRVNIDLGTRQATRPSLPSILTTNSASDVSSKSGAPSDVCRGNTIQKRS